jgi:beta-galactosidase
VLAHEQLRLPFERSPRPPLAPAAFPSSPSPAGTGRSPPWRAPDFAYGFDPATGLLTSIQWNGEELLAGPLRPDFWRAPNDNDRGSDMMKRLGVWRDAHRFLAVRSFRTETPARGVVRLVLQADLDRCARYDLTYTVYGTGDLVVEASFDPGEQTLPDLPRFGMQATARPGLRAAHLVRARAGGDLRGPPGPPGRRLLGPTVTDNYFRYAAAPGDRQQGRGALGGDHRRRGRGLLAVGQPRLSVNALHHSAADLDQAIHHHHLTPREETYLNLDGKQMGLGGDDSWGALPLEKHRIKAAPLSYRFRLRPIPAFRVADGPRPGGNAVDSAASARSRMGRTFGPIRPLGADFGRLSCRAGS